MVVAEVYFLLRQFDLLPIFRRHLPQVASELGHQGAAEYSQVVEVATNSDPFDILEHYTSNMTLKDKSGIVRTVNTRLQCHSSWVDMSNYYFPY